MTARISRFLYALFLFLVPSQLALHMWPSWSFAYGLPIDYLSPTLFATDCLILLLLVLWLFKRTHTFAVKITSEQRLLVLACIIGNIGLSASPFVTAITWVRLGIYCLFACTLAFRKERIFSHPAFMLGLVWTGLLALIQVASQHAAGGLWYWVGERPLSVAQFGVAKFNFGTSGLFMRPYASFPHPNALAGFLLASFFLIRPKVLKALITVIIILTLSRTILCIFLMLASLRYAAKTRHPHMISFVSILLIISIGIGALVVGDPSSVSERVYLVQQSLSLLAGHPLGVGLSAFIPALSTTNQLYANTILLQPVHNIYSVLITESGLPGITIFLFNLRKIRSLLVSLPALTKSTVVVILVSGFVDHYWVTAHQNQLLLVLLGAALLKSLHGVSADKL